MAFGNLTELRDYPPPLIQVLDDYAILRLSRHEVGRVQAWQFIFEKQRSPFFMQRIHLKPATEVGSYANEVAFRAVIRIDVHDDLIFTGVGARERKGNHRRGRVSSSPTSLTIAVACGFVQYRHGIWHCHDCQGHAGGLRLRVRPTGVKFAHIRTGDVQEFRRFFGCSVEFGAPSDQLEFSNETLALPLITADPLLLEVLRPFCEEAARTRNTAARSLRALVENEVQRLLPHRDRYVQGQSPHAGCRVERHDGGFSGGSMERPALEKLLSGQTGRRHRRCSPATRANM